MPNLEVPTEFQFPNLIVCIFASGMSTILVNVSRFLLYISFLLSGFGRKIKA